MDGQRDRLLWVRETAVFFLFYEVSSIRVAAQESVDVLTLTDSAEPISESEMKHRSTRQQL